MKNVIRAAIALLLCAAMCGCGEKLPEKNTSGDPLANALDEINDNGIPTEKDFEYLCETENITEGYKKYELDFSTLKDGKDIINAVSVYYSPETSSIFSIITYSSKKTVLEEVSLESGDRTAIFEFADGAVYMDVIAVTDEAIIYREGFDSDYSYGKSKSVMFDRKTGEKVVLAPYGTQEDDSEYGGVVSFGVIKGGEIYYDNMSYDDIAGSYSYNVERYNMMNGEHDIYEHNAVMPFKYRDTIAYMSYTSGKIVTDEMYQNDENLYLLNQQYASFIACDDTAFAYCNLDYESNVHTAYFIDGGEIKEIMKTASERSFIQNVVCNSGKVGINCYASMKPCYYDSKSGKLMILSTENEAICNYISYNGGIFVNTNVDSLKQTYIIL